MTNMIRRIEILESQIRAVPKILCQRPKVEGDNRLMASKAQTNYLSSLGGKVWESMTKEEAGKGIDSCLLNKKISEEIVEPKEVDTDDAGLDSEDLL